MQLFFPTMMAQSVRVAYGRRPPNVLAVIERDVDTGIKDKHGQSIKRRVVMAVEWMPFEQAVFFQMKMNEVTRTDDPRFGQSFAPELILPPSVKRR